MYSNVLPRQRHSSVRPLACIAPVADERFLNVLWCRGRNNNTHIATKKGIHVNSFEVLGSVFSTSTKLKSSAANTIVMIILTVGAG
jgi:hypothetical protein